MSLQNEYNFCKSWSNFLLGDNRSYEVIFNTQLDDYFINRVTLDDGLKARDIDGIIPILTDYSKLYNVPFYFHLKESEDILEKYFKEKGFREVDELYGLIFVQYLKVKGTLDDINWKINDKNNRISILTELNDLDDWVKVYCNSYNLENKSSVVFDILKKNFKKFIFLLYKDNYDDDENKRKMPVGCCLLYPYKSAIGLYCLGIVKEFRNKYIASKIIRYSILQSLKNDYHLFTLQTLKSDSLLSFYEKQGFCKIYSNRIFGLSNG